MSVLYHRQDGDRLTQVVSDSPRLKCSCAWFLKNPDAICHHVALVIRQGWDAWDPDSDTPRSLPGEVIVPIYAHRQGQYKMTGYQPLFVKLIIDSPEAVLSTIRGAWVDNSDQIGTLAQGEGRSVLREVVLDWLYSRELVIDGLECMSRYHNGRSLRSTLYSDTQLWVRDAFSLLTTSFCFTCCTDIGYPPDDL